MVTLRFDADAPKEERIGNVFVHRVGWGRRGLTYAQSFSPAVYLSKVFFVPLAALAARRLHQVHRFDGFWAMMSYMLFPIVLLRWSGIRVPFLVTLQEGDPFRHTFNRWFILPFRPLLSIGFKNASAVQAISTYLARWAKRMGYAGSVEVIPNGCDVKRFADTYPTQERRSFWGSRHVAGADTILITASRLVPKNALDVVIRALARLPKDVQFVILGDGKERTALTALARNLGVAERVHFLGEVPHAEIAQY